MLSWCNSLWLCAFVYALDRHIAHCVQVESAMGPALQAAFLAMQDFGGKMLLFQSAVPSLGEAPFKVQSAPSSACDTSLHAVHPMLLTSSSNDT